MLNDCGFMVICLPHLIFCAFSQALFWTFSAGEHFFYSVFYRTVVAGVPDHELVAQAPLLAQRIGLVRDGLDAPLPFGDARIGRAAGELLMAEYFTWKQRWQTLPRLLPFVVLIAVVMVALYDGWGTPSEVAAVGAAGSLLLVTVSFLPTPLAEAVLDERWPETAQLRVLLTGGDRLRRWKREGLGFSLVNHYGPTESTVVATQTVVERMAESLPHLFS